VDDARRRSERALALDPSDLDALRELAEARRRAGDEYLPAVVYQRLPAFDRESLEALAFGPSILSEVYETWRRFTHVRWYWTRYAMRLSIPHGLLGSTYARSNYEHTRAPQFSYTDARSR